jgi:LuxR family transcriptional regulator, maltose regulon positive regulatory protein
LRSKRSLSQESDTPRAFALLRTKLAIPLVRAGIVPRQRLIDRINEGLTGKLTLIAAPAGFGKTTLLTEWINQSRRSVGWLSLDEHDNAPARFWSYLIGAIQSVHPQIGENASALLGAQLRQSHPLRHEAFLTPLVNELSSLQSEFALVIDDYHFTTDSLINEGITFLLDHLPPQIHLILTSRADPPLPMARMRARNQLNELRAEDLRFTSDEAEEFLNHIMGLHLSAGSIFALESRTEGWIVGLQLAALSVQRLNPEHQRSFIRKFAGSHHFVVDYLAQEVIDTQSEEVKQFLLLTSVLDRLSGPLCDAVTGRSDGQAVLTSLERNNLFTVPLDEQGQWYRYHQLFADVLRHRLEHEQPSLVPDLHRRASAWFEQHGSIPEAMNHALAARDYESAIRLVEGTAGSMIKQGDTVTLLGWLDSLPAEVVRSRPWLSLAKAWAVVSQDRMQEAAEYLGYAERWATHVKPSHPDTRAVRGEAAAVRAMMGVMLDDAPAIINAAKKAFEYLPVEQKYLRGLVTMNFAVAHMLLGDLAEARLAGHQALRTGNEIGNRTLQYYSYFCLAGIERIQSNLHHAAENLHKALDAARTPGGAYLPIAMLAHRYLAEILYEWNDLDAAHRHISLALELGQSWWVRDEMIKSYMLLARIEKAQGNADAVRDALKQAEEFTDDRYALNLLTQIGLPSIIEWHAEGFLKPAFRWADKGLHAVKPEPEKTLHQGTTFASLVRLFLASENPATAQEALKLLMPAVENLTFAVIEALVLQALSLQAEGEVSRGLDCLNRALTLARPAGYVRTFLDEGEAMQSLLHRITGANRRYAATLIYAHHPSRVAQAAASKAQSGASITSGGVLIEPLSKRELEVIPLLAEGLSNLELARRLHISMDTVKVHLRHIYQKLGVNSRSKAAIRARELSLM